MEKTVYKSLDYFIGECDHGLFASKYKSHLMFAELKVIGKMEVNFPKEWESATIWGKKDRLICISVLHAYENGQEKVYMV